MIEMSIPICKPMVSDEEIKPFVYEALKIIGEIDEEDSLFIACALAYSDSIIWSDDKHFKQQDKVGVYTTKKLIDRFGL